MEKKDGTIKQIVARTGWDRQKQGLNKEVKTYKGVANAMASQWGRHMEITKQKLQKRNK